MHKKFCAHCGNRKTASGLVDSKNLPDYSKQKEQIKTILRTKLADLEQALNEVPIALGYTGIREAMETLMVALRKTKNEMLEDVIRTIEQVEEGDNRYYARYPEDADRFEDPDHDEENRAKYEESETRFLNRTTPRGEKLEEYYGEDSSVHSKQGPYKVKSVDEVKRRGRWL